MNMFWYGAFGYECRMCTLYGLFPGTLGFWEEQLEVIKFERIRPHVSCLRQLSALPLERVSMQYCAQAREQRTLEVRVRNSRLVQDGGEAVSVCLVGLHTKVASRISWKESLDMTFSQQRYTQ